VSGENADSGPVATRPVDVVGGALDGRFVLRTLELPERAAVLDRSRHRLVLERAGLEVYLFAFGAVVVVGRDTIDDDLRTWLEGLTGQKLLAETVDTYSLSIVPGLPRARAKWEQIEIDRVDEDVLEACALALARSVGLDRYEQVADPLLEEGLALARDLQGAARLPRNSRSMHQRMGALAVQRLELSRWFVHVDRPEAAWEDPSIAQLYDVLDVHFELAGRHQALIQRIASLEHTLSTLVSVWDARRARALEGTIVLLIVVEILLALWVQ
jgi:uncharacterized Rmd1/YagE family protein